MTSFFVYVRDDEVNKPEVRTSYHTYGGYEPPEPVWCADIVHAETPAKAKKRFLDYWAGTISSPVDFDDWTSLRVRVLNHDEAVSDDELWGRIHEILDHAGRPCDCPEVDE